MKVWVSRSIGLPISNIIVVSRIKPKTPTSCVKGTFAHGEEDILFDMSARNFKKTFQFTIEPGDCLKSELGLLDPKRSKQKKRKPSNELNCIRKY